MSKERKVDTEKLIKLDLEKNKEEVVKQKPNWFKRKGRKLQKIFSEFWFLGKTGFLFGSVVGATMGFIGGCMGAYQSKSLLIIPVSMLGSAFFFGSLMGIGACLRTQDGFIKLDENNSKVYVEYCYLIKDFDGKYSKLVTNSKNERICLNKFKKLL